uniref:pectin lyase n=1 Tax=Melanopsichium pennsylvanicum 4 TaxID=1398559 RepID=A0A077QZM7_9BASI|nr:related to Pectin lyase B precursor [Melanopsichium pennsylvanicum 4]
MGKLMRPAGPLFLFIFLSFLSHVTASSCDMSLDDMEVYHPIMGNQNEDPWKDCRSSSGQGGSDSVAKFGHRKRALGGEHWVGGHKHFRRVDGGVGSFGDAVRAPGGGNYDKFMPSAQSPGSGFGGGVTGSLSTEGGDLGAISSKPHGFAAAVTGGGSATPVIPRDVKELESLLASDSPAVIHLDKVYDYRGTFGTCTNCKGCVPDSYLQCPSKGQLAIDIGVGWCEGKRSQSVTYDKAGLNPLIVGSNKSIIGISKDAAIVGRGFIIKNVKNVILQNFRIEQINPEFVWGGDGVNLVGAQMIWIDKITFYLIGRQFIRTGTDASTATISNNHFDCHTKWSATCDDSHYWTLLAHGSGDRITFSGNLLDKCSGRSPKIGNLKGGDSVWHIVNSMFDTSSGHSLDLGPGITVLVEGNVFTNVAQTSLHESHPGRAFAPSDEAVCKQCTGVLGRECQPNAYRNAKPVPSTSSASVVLKDVAPERMSGALPPGKAAQTVLSTAGCDGKGEASSGNSVVGGEAGGLGTSVGSVKEDYGTGTGTRDGTDDEDDISGQGLAKSEHGAGTKSQESRVGDALVGGGAKGT